MTGPGDAPGTGRRGTSSDPRAAAAGILHDVLRRGQTLEEAMQPRPELDGLEWRDRAFARLIATTALRRLGQIDALIAACLERKLPAKAALAQDILRTGVVQLMFLGTPAHAAVDGTVALFAGRRLAPYRRLANAVLRRIARDGEGMRAEQDAPRLNTPYWLWTSWSAAFGERRCRAIAESHLMEPPLDVTVAADAEVWAGRLEAETLPTGSLRLRARGAVSALPGYGDGGWWVQDAAAALPARLLLSGLGEAAVGARVADLCAAPGGKTAQLAQAGAAVTALDRSPTRLARVADNLRRLGLEAALVEADVASWRCEEEFDAVLLDAPCSGTGTLRRHPDIARQKTSDDVARLAEIQATLLPAAAALVRPGGLLVYSVCSLQPEEGPMRLEAFLATGAPFERAPVAPGEIGGIAEAVTDLGDLTTLPCHLAERGGLDGFYAARLRRKMPR